MIAQLFFFFFFLHPLLILIFFLLFLLVGCFCLFLVIYTTKGVDLVVSEIIATEAKRLRKEPGKKKKKKGIQIGNDVPFFLDAEDTCHHRLE